MDELKIDDKSYDYSELRAKYAQFISPKVRIFIDNNDVTDKLKISEIEVENSVYKSGYFEFRVVNAFDSTKKDFLFDDILSVGLSIKIDFGYNNKFHTVFVGNITSISYNMSVDDGPIIIVNGLDKSFLLMKGKKSAIWQDKTHSDIVKNIAGKYKMKVISTDTKKSYETVVQNQMTDYEFLTYLANLNSYEFFVIGSNIYFRKINEDKSSIITLTMFENIITANICTDIGDIIGGVTVRGYSIAKEETESVVKTIKKVNKSGKDGVELVNSLDDKNLLHYIYEPNIDSQEAEMLGNSYLEKVAMNYISGEIKIMGIPELIAGRYITVCGIKGIKSKQLLYAKSVKHIINENGYATHIELGGNSL